VLVDDAGVRRYVQRLVGLEYPRLAVLARDELAGAAEGRIVATIDGPPEALPRPIGAQASIVAPRPAATPRPDLRSGGRHAERRVELLGAAPHLDPAVGVAEALLPALDDTLFDELGLLMPPLCCVLDSRLTPGRFQLRLNGLHWPEQSGDGAARVQALRTVVQAEAKHLLDADAVRCLLDLLHEAHPALVEATRQRFDLPLLTDLLCTLLGDAVPIRDLRAILEALLAVRGHQSPPAGADEASLRLDAAGYEREIRNALRHAICAPLSSDGVMHVHELAPALQARLQAAAAPWDDPALVDAVARAAEEDRSAGRACVLLVADALRRPLREATRRAVASVAVLAYDDLHVALNIQPGRAIGA
jgi:flagellar biosynthesis component FlhA